jgi:hypothetical protein
LISPQCTEPTLATVQQPEPKELSMGLVIVLLALLAAALIALLTVI